MTFVDGAPLDATVLNKLLQDYAKIEASVPKVGSAGLGSSLQEEIRPTEMYGGRISAQKITPGAPPTVYKANFNGAFSYPPLSVVATVFSNTGNINDDSVSLSVGNITAAGADVFVWIPKGTSKEPKNVSVMFFAISHSI